MRNRLSSSPPAIQDKHHLLLVDDDHRLRQLIGRYFKRAGYHVTVVASAHEARSALEFFMFDAAILDINLGGESGLSLGREISARGQAPVLYLSALSEADDRIKGLESGGADYLTKPFEPRELELRIEHIIAHFHREEKPELRYVTIGNLKYDLNRRTLTNSAGEIFAFSRNEMLAMHTLALSCPKPIDRTVIAEEVGAVSDRAIDALITRLRRKLESSGDASQVIITVRGQGYRLNGQVME